MLEKGVTQISVVSLQCVICIPHFALRRVHQGSLFLPHSVSCYLTTMGEPPRSKIPPILSASAPLGTAQRDDSWNLYALKKARAAPTTADKSATMNASLRGVDIHNTIKSASERTVTLSGWLEKKGQVRWFVLKEPAPTARGVQLPASLDWYRKQGDGLPRGSIERLPDWELQIIGPLHNTNVFKLSTANNTNQIFKTQSARSYLLKTKNHTELREWVNRICAAKKRTMISPSLPIQFPSSITLQMMPEEVLFVIFTHLNLVALHNLGVTSKLMWQRLKRYTLHRHLTNKQSILILPANTDIDSYIKWEEVLQRGAGWMSANASRITKMMLEHGLPDDLRGRMWMTLAHVHFLKAQDPRLYDNCLSKKLEEEQEIQIELDLPRTFPEHPDFITESGTKSLGNVLRAFCAYNDMVEYAQGCNFLAGIMITVLDDQSAFYLLIQLMNNYDFEGEEERVRDELNGLGMYSRGFPGLKKKIYIFDRLFEKLDPVLYHHFKAEGIEATMFGPQWFLTLFSTSLPMPLIKRIWDLFFLQGWRMIMSAAFCIFRIDRGEEKREGETLKETESLLKKNFEGIMTHIREMEKTYEDVEKCDALLRMIPNVSIKDKDVIAIRRAWELDNNVFATMLGNGKKK
ncbi:GTPase activating protein [Planoprotostelium fungivorum]|uniref:GTPase activating protein n=1 Tax=Planoprotostelium fungivorum TaxID=1890364 RepID=A0A2P6N8E9_9EUKA|nr:GTPase activating protein [Planoprotostelium fungivorum]